MSQNVDKTPFRVVLDTNTWRQTHLLRDATGRAFLYHLRRLRGQLGLPEVVEREMLAVLVETGMEFARQAENSIRQLRLLTGLYFDEIKGLTRETLAETIRKGLGNLGDVIHRVPIQLQHVHSAVEAAITRLPPNRQREQVRDSLIWEAVAELAVDSPVIFVSGDKAYYSESKYECGLADQLKEMSKGRVSIFPSLRGCLDHFKITTPSVDVDLVATLVRDEIEAELRDRIARKRFTIVARQESDLSLYSMEKTVAVDFRLKYSLEAAVDGPPSVTDAICTVFGNCYYEAESVSVKEAVITAVEYRWHDNQSHIAIEAKGSYSEVAEVWPRHEG